MWIVVALIAYASFYPFDLHWSRLADSLDGSALREFASPPSNPSDTIANLLFYLPLGYALLLHTAAWRNFAARLAVCVAIGGGLSLLIEWLQHLVPERTPSLLDVALNVISTALGAIVGRVLHRTEPSRTFSSWLSADAIDPVATASLACWIAVHTFPFLPKLGLYRSWEAIETLRHLKWTSGGAVRWFASYLILAALLKALVQPPRFWNALIVVAVASLLAQIVFREHHLEFDECIGFVTALPLVAWLRRSPRWAESLQLWFLVIVGVLWSALYPFDFTLPARAMNWMPFSGALDAEMQNGAISLLTKTFFYGGSLWVGARACGNLIFPTTLLFLVTAITEALQTWLPTRTPESTDPLMVLLLAGLIAMARQWRPKEIARPSEK